MTPRLDYFATAPKLMGAMLNLQKAVASSGLEESLIRLVEVRASQINGCAFCIDMHTRAAREGGEARPGSTCWTPGARPRTTRRASAPPWPGPRR
jgi:AhpD family alkylhydroperoxidase